MTSVTEAARTRHKLATQKMLAASDTSHVMRKDHGAEILASDARHEFRNMGQTLIPLLLDELDEARRLLAKRVQLESQIVDLWLSGTTDLRYIELSRGRSRRFMATLWQLDARAEDKKVGHAEGGTISEAVQNAQGVIIL